MSIENLNVIVKPIGKLAIPLAVLEKVKGQRKLIDDEEKEAKIPFYEDAGNSAVLWISESGQKLISEQWQEKTSYSRDALLAAGVTEEQLAIAGKVSRFPVLRLH